MSSEWRPDDSLLDLNAKGQVKGALRVRDALRKAGVRSTRGITTSRDPGVAAAQRSLKRTGMPAGVEQWQLPVAQPLDNLAIFISRMKPGTVVPMHSHDVWVFRVIISGSLRYKGKIFKAGDWILVPPGQNYSIKAGPTGCLILYGHCKWPPGP